MIIFVCGWPGSGKTTTARQLCAQHKLTHYSCDIEVGHAQKNPGAPIIYIPQHLGWSEGSQYVIDHWIDRLENVVIEGNAIPRVLRKWAKSNGQHVPPPCDKLMICKGSYRPIGPGQVAMGKGSDTVLNEILPWLLRYPVIEYRN